MASTLLQLQVVDSEGKLQRDVIVTAAMRLYHLHRVIQFCVKPLQSDDTIAAQKYKFTHKSSRTELKAPKSKQLYQAGPAGQDCLAIGTCWVYQCGNLKLEVQLKDKEDADAKRWVPRCIGGSGGNIKLDTINKKLLERRFTKTAAYKAPKQPPAILCSADTTNDQIFKTYMNAMQRPLRGFQWEQDLKQGVLPASVLAALKPNNTPAEQSSA